MSKEGLEGTFVILISTELSLIVEVTFLPEQQAMELGCLLLRCPAFLAHPIAFPAWFEHASPLVSPSFV
jgi:hypothetical protein